MRSRIHSDITTRSTTPSEAKSPSCKSISSPFHAVLRSPVAEAKLQSPSGGKGLALLGSPLKTHVASPLHAAGAPP